MEVINKWFASQTKAKMWRQADIGIEVIADLLTSKQLVSDRDTGVKHIMKSLGMKEQERIADIRVNYAHFQRIFCRSIFKESLIEVLREIEDGIHR